MNRHAKATVFALLIATAFACDRPTIPEFKTATTSPPTKVVPPPFRIEPKVWGDVPAGPTYELKLAESGNPALYAPDGGFLLDLLPEVLVDVAPAGKRRIKPHRERLELVKLSPLDGGGFEIFARAEDRNGTYDLRVAKGPNDPRVHAQLTTTWSRDLDVYRHAIVFDAGALGSVRGVGLDYDWTSVGDEWTSPAHAPHVMRFGEAEAAFGVVGEEGLDGLTVHRDEDARWEVELDAYHWASHPVDYEDPCDGKGADGSARVSAGSRMLMRADFVLGEVSLPFVSRLPHRARAGVALFEVSDSSVRTIDLDVELVEPDARSDAGEAASEPIERPSVKVSDATDFAPVAAAPCSEGSIDLEAFSADRNRKLFTGLADAPQLNLLAYDEADARRAIVFSHPDAIADPVLVFRATAVAAADIPAVFHQKALEQLAEDRGLAIVQTDLDALLLADAGPTQSVSDMLASAHMNPEIWLAPAGALVDYIDTASSIRLEFLPQGVVRIHNPTSQDVLGLTILLPDGVAARWSDSPAVDGAATFDIVAGGEQLLQLFSGDVPFQPFRPANLRVAPVDAAGSTDAGR